MRELDMLKAITPQDVLSDSDNFTNINGTTVRKGSIAAFLQNIDLLEHAESTDQKDAALSMIKELAPAIIATGLYTHVTFKNPVIQEILNDTNKQCASQDNHCI